MPLNVPSLNLINNGYIIKEMLLSVVALQSQKNTEKYKTSLKHPRCHIKTENVLEINKKPSVLTRNFDLSTFLPKLKDLE